MAWRIPVRVLVRCRPSLHHGSTSRRYRRLEVGRARSANRHQATRSVFQMSRARSSCRAALTTRVGCKAHRSTFARRRELHPCWRDNRPEFGSSRVFRCMGRLEMDKSRTTRRRPRRQIYSACQVSGPTKGSGHSAVTSKSGATSRDISQTCVAKNQTRPRLHSVGPSGFLRHGTLNSAITSF